MDALCIHFWRRSDIEEQLAHLQRGALFVPVPEPPPEPFVELAVLLWGPDDEPTSLSATVVQITPDMGMALQLEGADDTAATLRAWLAQTENDDELPGIAVSWEDSTAADDNITDDDSNPDDDSLEEPPAEESSDDTQMSLHDRIKTMSSAEKRKLALYGDRGARLLLLKDPNKMLHPFIMQNKGLTAEEVRYIAGFRQTNPDVLKQIAENTDWTQNPRIVQALVTNPKTPSTAAIRLLPKLGVSELRRLARGGNVPPAVSAAAKKMIIKA